MVRVFHNVHRRLQVIASGHCGLSFARLVSGIGVKSQLMKELLADEEAVVEALVVRQVWTWLRESSA